MLPFAVLSSVSQANDWETLPVFSGGRIMPLHTFAQQTVKEICGTSRPFIIRDEAVLGELNSVIELYKGQEDRQASGRNLQGDGREGNSTFPFLIRGSDLDGGFGKQYSIFDVEHQHEQVSSTLPIKGLTRLRAEKLVARIRSLVPPGGRYFNADELLLSWVNEPEVWTFLPIFLVKETDYHKDVLELALSTDTRTSEHRVSLYQLAKANRYQQRLADIARRKQLGQVTEVPIRYDGITERLEEQATVFRELTFHPRRSQPVRMIQLLEQASGLTSDQASYALAFDAWRYLLTVGEVPAKQSVEPIDPNKEIPHILHPTTQRWHDIASKMQLLIRAFNRIDSGGKMIPPNTDAVERQFEQLIGMLDTNLEESAALMKKLYPAAAFSQRQSQSNQTVNIDELLPLFSKMEKQPENQQMLKRLIPSYHYAVKRLRYEVEAAYLALYDNGNSLRILPVHSIFAAGGLGKGHETFGVQPWGTIQMVVSSGEAFAKRFFDPNFRAPTDKKLPEAKTNANNITDNTTEENNAEKNETVITEPVGANSDAAPDDASENKNGQKNETALTLEENQNLTPEEKQLGGEMFAQQGNDEELVFGESEDAPSAVSGSLKLVRTNFGQLFGTAMTAGVEYGDYRFNARAAAFETALRNSAYNAERSLETLVDSEDPQIKEFLTKTAYPVAGKTNAEYRYAKLAPFFWMFIFGAIAAVLGSAAYVIGIFRRETFADKTVPLQSSAIKSKAQITKEQQAIPDHTDTIEEYVNFAAILMLLISVFITFAGGVQRALISGWAPFTNMYETVVFTAFCAALFGIWYSLYPLLQPAIQIAWKCTSFPLPLMIMTLWKKKNQKTQQRENETAGDVAMREAAEVFGVSAPTGVQNSSNTDTNDPQHLTAYYIFWQSVLSIPRLILTLLTLAGIVQLCNGSDAAEHGFFAALTNLFAQNDLIDTLVVLGCTAMLVWYIPKILLTFGGAVFLLLRPNWIAAELGIVSSENALPQTPLQPQMPRSELSGIFAGETALGAGDVSGNSGKVWLQLARNGILDRKLFTVIAAVVSVLAGLAAYLNSTQFNPDIRPIAAVLRSNFWLTVHVIAIIASYAAAFVAWGMSAVALGSVVFGKFEILASDSTEGRPQIQLPAMSLQFAPIIDTLLKISMLLLIIGTLLGARWADYSWGRFWSWDPKEVWALITILFYAVILHGRIAGFYGRIGIMVGALFSSIAVIITWYGINYVFKGSMHSYGGGAADNATMFLGLFIIANILWGALAILRCTAEQFGRE
ncbi:hypothetical protein FACS189443_0930 [Planctomycetales bacterium]|nr:hypothetical protein FACS189443_0930 [Planctomycetales bacterium]